MQPQPAQLRPGRAFFVTEELPPRISASMERRRKLSGSARGGLWNAARSSAGYTLATAPSGGRQCLAILLAMRTDQLCVL